MFFHGLLDMDTLVLADQQKLTSISSVQTLDAILRTCKEWWFIGTDGERESRGFVLSARIDDDDDDDLFGFVNQAVKS